MPRRGGTLAPAIGKALLRLFGWRLTGQPPNIRKIMVAVAPHTSNWDFVLGVLVMWAMDLRLNFFGKHTLFKGVFGKWMRSIGGIPVDRGSAHGLVGEAVNAFKERETLWFAIAPEGTRKKVEHFKSGFMHIATQANVPVLLVSFDLVDRVVHFGDVLQPSGDVAADVTKIEAYFKPLTEKVDAVRVRGKK
ncbi:MAG: lysophospholipid acyltransferase family protein [Burkholderiales bacterium]|nr:lysophospholipid acyltransferase family protein [Burkholderiales bacterium]